MARALVLTGLFLPLLAVTSACSLDRSGIGVPGRADAGEELDAFFVDGGTGGDDAQVERDANVEIDAFVPRDSGACTGDDSDGDGTPDACDLCPDADDRIDTDGDGTPDKCDEWPCGAAPPSIGETISAEGIQISEVSIEGGGNTAVVTAGTDFALDLRYAIRDDACGSCVDQVEIGFDPGNRVTCVYDANPPGGGSSGAPTETLTAPTTAGLYELRFNLGQNYSCFRDGATLWWDAAPPRDQTFGAICVVP